MAQTITSSAALEDERIYAQSSRFLLIRNVILFQVKLALDGLRDFVMSPLSIMAAVIGVLFGGRNPEWAYQRLLAFGRRTDVWINLFDQFPANQRRQEEGPNVDEMVDYMEDLLRRDYEAGGMSARTEEKIRTMLDGLRR